VAKFFVDFWESFFDEFCWLVSDIEEYWALGAFLVDCACYEVPRG